jgi:phosphomannomutase
MSFVKIAQDWIQGDVDAADIAAVEHMIATGDEAALKATFERAAAFGTAGLRELVGPGPGQLNLAVIRRTTFAVANFLLKSNKDPSAHTVVLGYDARTHSRSFAAETAGVLTAAGLKVRYFETPVPTPLVAFALRSYAASAAIVITASHNSKEYNGYKLYAPNGAQIVSPTDEIIAAMIAAGPRARDIAMQPGALDGAQPLALPVEAAVMDSYFAAIDALRPRQTPKRDLNIVYTPLHGVGYAPLRRAFDSAGFTALSVVESEAQPNGDFPDLPDPNPEKSETLAKARQKADAVGAELILANDPDADRLAVSIRNRDGSWLALKGNQIGVLLADYMLSRYDGDARPMVAYSIVSSPMIERIADDYGAHAEATLTGFKWVWNAAIDLGKQRGLHFVFGFEEALGYCAGDIVRDKDGISAALLFAEMAAEDASHGGSVLQRLQRLYRKHGAWVSQQVSIERKEAGGLALLRQAVEDLATKPPKEIRGTRVERVTDYRSGGERRPRWLENNPMLRLDLESGVRVLVRPSGTEPKLKIYVDLCRPLEPSSDIFAALADADNEAKAIGRATAELAGLG